MKLILLAITIIGLFVWGITLDIKVSKYEKYFIATETFLDTIEDLEDSHLSNDEAGEYLYYRKQIILMRK